MSSNESKPHLTEEERAYARALLLALEPFRNVKTTMPLSYVYTFLLVATDEGKGVNDYATKAGISPTVMTRHLLDVGDRNRQREEGLGLITQERDLYDLRKHNATVTPKGRTLLHKVITALKNAPKGSAHGTRG